MRQVINKLLALLFIALISLPAWSQPDFNDSTEVYNYWGKRGIVEVVYSYMQDYIATNQKASAEKKGMDAYNEKFIKGIENRSLTDIENDFKGLNDFLSNNSWSSTAKKMASPLKERLEKKQLLNSSFFSVVELHSQGYTQTVQIILNNYNKSIQKFKVKPAGIITPPISNPNITPENLPTVPPPNITFISYLWIIAIFILGFVIGGFLIYYYSKHKVLSILNSEKHEYNRILKENNNYPLFFKFISFIEILKNRKDEYKSGLDKKTPVEQVANFKQEIADLKSKNKELLVKNIELGQKLENFKLEGRSGTNEPKDPNGGANNYKTFFYSIPEVDGTFKTENAKDYNEHDSFYKLELISNTNGNIYFLSGDFDLRAIENIDYYLNPVCEVQNIANRTFAKKVEMINHGTIVLKGDSWQINNKIKIKLV